MIRIILVLLTMISITAVGQSEEKPDCTVEVPITDVIGPATHDLLHRVEAFAAERKCSSILLLINTPGGSLDSTRRIVETILNSEFPYLCLISPGGGHAGSAGAIILQACHVNGAINGTRLGAATPVMIGGEIPEDLRKKIMNDTRSWLESLTRLRGRNEKFGQDIILKATAVTSEEAYKLKAIDFVGGTKNEFLEFAKNRTVKMPGNKTTDVVVGETIPFDLDLRYKVVSLLTDPELAYVLLLGSLGLLYFEITHPGMILPGVIGAIGFVISMVAMHKLEVEWGGLALIFLGIAMLIAEMFVPSFGALGIGGIVAFIFGSIFLFDPAKTGGFQLPLSLILSVAFALGVIFLGIGYMLLSTRKLKKAGGFDDLMGQKARVVTVEESSGQRGTIEVRGEIWKFESPVAVSVGDQVRIRGHEGLVLKVEKET